MANEYFKRNDKNEIVLISNKTEYRITFATTDDIDYFYQYPTMSEMELGKTIPIRRMVSEISDSLPE